jgi:hypothetical protein
MEMPKYFVCTDNSPEVFAILLELLLCSKIWANPSRLLHKVDHKLLCYLVL